MGDSASDGYPSISSLNHLLYCERRCALLRIENVWVENAYTLSGSLSHERADIPVDWIRSAGVREVHGIWLKSDRLRLVGKSDVVEFHPAGHAARVCDSDEPASKDTTRGPRVTTSEIPYPIEYKRGKRRRWDNDDVQLCAQALCLEEMLGASVPRGAIYHIQSKRRREVVFTPELRRKTEATAARLHELLDSAKTPPPVLKPRCDGCSLREICLPEALGDRERVRQYVSQLFHPISLPKGTP